MTRATPGKTPAALLLVWLAFSGCQEPPGPQLTTAILWTHRDRSGAYGQPYADSTLAVFTTFGDTRIVALDARTGALRWERKLVLPPGAPYGDLPLANVVGFDSLVIVPAWDLYGLDRRTGEVRWVFQPPDDFPAAASVAISEGRVYSPGGTHLYCADAATGTMIWETDLGERPFQPLVDGGMVFVPGKARIVDPNGDTSNVLGAGYVIALDASTGAIRWRFFLPDVRNWLGGSEGPLAPATGVLIVPGMNGQEYGLDRETGALRWTYAGSGPYGGGAVVVGGTAIVAGDAGSIEGIDVQSGRLRWATRDEASVTHALTLAPGTALVTTGSIRAFDAEGRVRWEAGGAAAGGPIFFIASTYSNGLVFSGGEAGFHAVRVP